MIRNREFTEYPWRVFQAGHFGWWYTNQNSRVCPQPFHSKDEAEKAMMAHKDDQWAFENQLV